MVRLGIILVLFIHYWFIFWIRLTLWGPRCIWGPWDVLICPDICAFFQLLINILMAQVNLHYIKHKQGYHNMWATCMYMFVFLREYCLCVVIENPKNESFWNKATKHWSKHWGNFCRIIMTVLFLTAQQHKVKVRFVINCWCGRFHDLHLNSARSQWAGSH